MKTTTVSSILLAISSTAQAAILVDWNLNTVNYPTHPAAAVNNDPFTGVPSSAAAVALNLTVGNLVSGSAGGTGQSGGGIVWSSGNAGPGKLNLQRWDYVGFDTNTTTATGDGVPNNWIQFTLTASPGYQFTIESIDLTAWRNGAGAPGGWRFDIWNGTAWEPFDDVHNQATSGIGTSTNVNFTGSVTDDELLIRFIAVGPVGGTGNVHVESLVFNGSVIPEPATALLGGLGLLTLLRRRR
jgi:hypothetical protein